MGNRSMASATECWSALVMMQQERRRSMRKAPRRPTYINLESKNPGIVRDVSEGGLRFRVIDPLERSWQIHFWFVANSNRIRGTGDLVWMDETRKTGGLRFTHLSMETRDQIRSWLDESSPQPVAPKESTPSSAARDASPFRKSNHFRVPAGASDISLRPSQSQSPVSELNRQKSFSPECFRPVAWLER
jgi:hypothetical protein